MRFSFKSSLIAVGLLAAMAAQAQALPADAPAGTTVQCKDGSYASPASKAGACRGHKGVQTWYGGKADAKAAAAPAAAATAVAPAAAAKPAPSTAMMAAPQGAPAAAAAAKPAPSTAMMAAPAAAVAAVAPKAPAPADTTAMAAAPGGGAGKVWANDETKVYHCANDRYYGKTKKGEYLSEADAKAKGFHAANGKACS